MKKNNNGLAILASLGGLLLGYSNGIIGGALLFIQPLFHLTNFSQGLIASITIIGSMLGIYLVSRSIKHDQHKNFILASAFIFAIGLLSAAFALNAAMIILGRFLCGIGIGITFVVIPPYLAEMAPPKWRGAFVAAFQLAITFGSLLGCAVSYWCAPYQAWRWMFIFGLCCACLVFFGSLFLPPIAKKIIPSNAALLPQQKIFSRQFRKPFLIGISIAILQQVTGIMAVMYFAPQILQSANHSSTTAAIFSALIVNAGNFLFTILSLFLLDYVGRRPILLFSLLAQFIALLLIGILSKGSIDATRVLFICCLMIYIFGFAVGLGPAGWLIISEIYPAAIRSKAIGITIMINNIAAFIISITFLNLLHWLNQANTFWLYSVIALLGFIFIWFYVPETKQLSLDEIENLS